MLIVVAQREQQVAGSGGGFGRVCCSNRRECSTRCSLYIRNGRGENDWFGPQASQDFCRVVVMVIIDGCARGSEDGLRDRGCASLYVSNQRESRLDYSNILACPHPGGSLEACFDAIQSVCQPGPALRQDGVGVLARQALSPRQVTVTAIAHCCAAPASWPGDDDDALSSTCRAYAMLCVGTVSGNERPAQPGHAGVYVTNTHATPTDAPRAWPLHGSMPCLRLSVLHLPSVPSRGGRRAWRR